MREAGRTLAGGSRQAILRKTLVVAEVALAVVLLAGSSVLLRKFVALGQVDLGYAPERILTMRVPLPPDRYPDAARRIAFFQELLPRVRAVPGVAAAGLNSGLHPLGNMTTTIEVIGEAASPEPALVHQIEHGYLDTYGLRAVQGRLLTESDVTAVQPVALVNERFVQTRLAERPPLGRTVRVNRIQELPFGAKHVEFQIVGVVRDTLNDGLVDPVRAEVYIPFTVTGLPLMVSARSHGDVASITRAVVSQVYAIDKGQPVTGVMTLDAVLKDNEYSTPRFNLVLLSLFGVLGLLLAIVGVYGVMSSAVAQERQEIGIRMALGAASGSIARMIVLRGSRLLLLGIAIGLVGSYAAGRLLAGEVWNVAAFDPIAFTLVTAVLMVTGLQACFWPARRAARIDPIIALRQET
jgi:putative ABC transport system permease protein